MIITPYSVFFSVILGSVYLLFLKMTYRFLLRHNCFRLVLFISFLVIFRFVFVIDLPIDLTSNLLLPVSERITLFVKSVFEFVPNSLKIFLSINKNILASLLLIIWSSIAAILIIRDGIILKSIICRDEILKKSHNITAEKILRQIQKTMGVSYDIKIICSKYVLGPFVCGLKHPVIYLNTNLEENELYVILCHEMTHIIYHDNWVKMLFHYIKLILWWNPLVYLMLGIIEEACECRCDYVITKNMSKVAKIDYASMINKYATNDVYLNQPACVKSSYAQKKENDYIYQRILAFLKPQPLNYFTKLFYTFSAVIIVIGSLAFSLPTISQEKYFSALETELELSSDSSYLILNSDGSYSLFSEGMLIDNDITDINIYNLPIREETK